jgi:hypothetical protein
MATATGPYSVALSFTATGDDGTSGQAALYDLRYATESITAANWDAATPATGEPLPQWAGLIETLAVEDLDPATTYYFALEVMDEAGNASGLSNVAPATTDEAPPDVWTAEVVDPVGGGYKALDFHGGPGSFSVGCANSIGNSVVALLWDGTQWVRETVDANTTDGAGIDFAFAPDGTPSVSYGWGKIKFAWRNSNGTWTVEFIEGGRANNDFTSLTYDPVTGEPTVAYRKGGNLQFARKVGGLLGTWQVETVRAAGARNQDLIYDRDGHPVIAFSDDPDGDGWLSALKVATKIGSAWQVETLHEGMVGQGVWASIAIDSLGDMIAADSAASRVWVFHKPAGGSWDAGDDVADGGNIHAMFDGADTPYISLVFGSQTSVAFNDGTGWQVEPVQDNTGGRTDIRRDPQGGLGVLYGRNEGGIGLARKPLQ